MTLETPPNQRVKLTSGILRHFRAFLPGRSVQDRLASGFTCSQAESTPAYMQTSIPKVNNAIRYSKLENFILDKNIKCCCHHHLAEGD